MNTYVCIFSSQNGTVTVLKDIWGRG